MLNRRTDNRQAALAVSPTTVAVGLVFCFVFLSSFFPALIAKWGTESPFLFATAWQAGAVLGMLTMLVIGYRALFFNRSVWRLLLGRTLSWSMLFWMLAQCDGALFARSAGIIDVSISTVLYQLSPVFTILLIERLFRSEGRYRAWAFSRSWPLGSAPPVWLPSSPASPEVWAIRFPSMAFPLSRRPAGWRSLSPPPPVRPARASGSAGPPASRCGYRQYPNMTGPPSRSLPWLPEP